MSTPPTDSEELAAIVRFFSIAGQLKRTTRTGWRDRGVPGEQVESVADHTFRVALMAWLVAPPELDRNRLLKLALLHDLAEATTGDLTPYAPDEVTDRQDEDRQAFLNQRHVPTAERLAAKRAGEARAFTSMTSELPDTVRCELEDLWAELEARESPEARFVKQIDKLETYLQSREYAAVDSDLAVASFAAEVAEVVTDPGLAALRDVIAGVVAADKR
jgi:putative hydrolase of HD superfamily